MNLYRLLLSFVLSLVMVGCQSTLHKAAEYGQIKKVEKLIAQGAQVNTVDDEGWLPLSRAATNDRVEIINILLNHGANPNMANQNSQNWAPLHAAAVKGRVDAAYTLMNRGAEVNIITQDGWTPLMLAAREGFTGVARAFLSRGAGVNIKKKDGFTALHLAAYNNHESMVQLLIGKHANVNAKQNEGKTPAQLTNNRNILIMLKNAGAKIPNQRIAPPRKNPTVNLAPKSIAWKTFCRPGVCTYRLKNQIRPGSYYYQMNCGGIDADMNVNHFMYKKTGPRTAVIDTGHGELYRTQIFLVFDTKTSGRVIMAVYDRRNSQTFRIVRYIERPNSPFFLR